MAREYVKKDNMLSKEIRYKKTEKGMMITEYYGNDSYVVLPDEIEGEPVTILEDYAFSRNLSVEEIWMPLDMGGGALTGCHLEEVEIYLQDGKKSCLKSIVEEMRYQMRIYLHAPEGGQEAKLLFPEHYEEAVENTPARILETHHHGAGGYYRQCFYDRELDYRKYDEMFYHTVAEDTEETAVELALNRLRFPAELSDKNRQGYEEYLKKHMTAVAKWTVKQEEVEGIRFLQRRKLWTEQSLQAGMDFAAEDSKTEILSIFMDIRKDQFPKKKKTFEL